MPVGPPGLPGMMVGNTPSAVPAAQPRAAPTLPPLQRFNYAPPQRPPILTGPQFIRKLASELVAAGMVKRDQKLTPQDRTMIVKAYESYLTREQQRQQAAGTTAFEQQFKTHDYNQAIPRAQQGLNMGALDLLGRQHEIHRLPIESDEADRARDLQHERDTVGLTEDRSAAALKKLELEGAPGVATLKAEKQRADIGKVGADTRRVDRSGQVSMNQLMQSRDKYEALLPYTEKGPATDRLLEKIQEIETLMDKRRKGRGKAEATEKTWTVIGPSEREGHTIMRSPSGKEYDVPNEKVAEVTAGN